MYSKFDIAEVKTSNRKSMLFLVPPEIPHPERYNALRLLMLSELDYMKMEHKKFDEEKEKLQGKEV